MKSIISSFIVLLLTTIVCGQMIVSPEIPPVVYSKPHLPLYLEGEDTAYFDIYFYTGGRRNIWEEAGANVTMWGTWGLCIGLDIEDGPDDSVTILAQPLKILQAYTKASRVAHSNRDTLVCYNDTIPIFDPDFTWANGIELDTAYYRALDHTLMDYPGQFVITSIDTVYCYPEDDSVLHPYGPDDGVRIWIFNTGKLDTFSVFPWSYQQ